MTGEELLFLAQQGSTQREGDTQDKTPGKLLPLSSKPSA
ncbi:hypothetical protein HMPREF1323_1286 [Porphyromonas sp. oral taxon 279 str. F0450]|nr:hypothetical protein HMPREF1323_1286 [Porphyromonas sp. oral taxon 279 str. F0450]